MRKSKKIIALILVIVSICGAVSVSATEVKKEYPDAYVRIIGFYCLLVSNIL